MFIGEYSHTIDAKGRVSMPAKFRRLLSKGVVVTRGLDRCLLVYSREAWEVMAKKLAALPITSQQSRAFSRLMLAGAWDVELDSQGRIILPEYLRQYASLAKHVTITGLYDRIEIWNEDAWQQYRAQTEAASGEIAASLSDLGI